ncbi:MAG: toxic anion resistance protein [Brooklawnia sp.]|uniref:toxic anion resistance protein n=1 Tax=Brooklawnia sp. TaxID=2699740 RepID=UPI003C73BBE4
MSQNPQGSYGQSGYTQPGQPGGSGPQDRTQAGVPQRLTPPEGAAVLTLEAPAPPPVVQATQAPELAPPVTEEQRPALDAKVNQFMGAIMAEQSGSPEFSRQADAVRSMGDADIRRAAEMSNRLLETPLNEMKTGGLSDVSRVSSTLVELRRIIEDLDPSEVGAQKKFLGIIPFGDKIQDYFRKYQSSQKHLNAILHSLRSGQDELTKDNVSLNMEKQQLWDTMNRLNQYIYLAEQLDNQLSAAIAELQVTDPMKADALNKDVLFYVRQKHQDLLTQLAVSIQGYLAIDVIIKNNAELIKGVDRASTTTVSALRTAVITAQALGNQKLVLDQITALNVTTSGLIERTSEMLRDNSVTIQQQAASSTVSIEALQKAFANVYQTMDSIDSFKIEALNTMSQTIGTLEAEVSKSRAYLERARQSDDRRGLAEGITSTPNYDLG